MYVVGLTQIMDHFNCHVAPFPNSGDHLYSQVGNAPPQKLCPIRPSAGGSHQNGEYCFFNMEDPKVPNFVFGSSLDDNDDAGDSLQRTKEPRSRNRRRKKMGRKLRDLAENFVKKVMEKQEEMHEQLVDVIEKNERERLMREEIWKQKEMERFKMDDEEVTIREISRNFAVISSIQKLMGQEILIPQPCVRSERGEDDGDTNIQKDLES